MRMDWIYKIYLFGDCHVKCLLSFPFHRLPESNTSTWYSNTATKPRINTTTVACIRMFSTTAQRIIPPETFARTSTDTTGSAAIGVLQKKTVVARSRSYINFRVNIYLFFVLLESHYRTRRVGINFHFHKCDKFKLSRRREGRKKLWLTNEIIQFT